MMARSEGLWRLWIDTGGTFTDCVATDPRGGRRRLKVLSDSSLRGRIGGVARAGALHLELTEALPAGFLAGRELRLQRTQGPPRTIVSSAADGTVTLDGGLDARPGDAWEIRFPFEVPVLAAHLATAIRPGDELPPIAMRLATTRATNALLERSGARTLLVVTRGFGDLLRIGNQQRPELFAMEIRRPEPLYHEAVEVDERLDASGAVVRPLDRSSLESALGGLVAGDFGAAAVVLLHGYRNPAHELEVEAALRRLGLPHVSRSSEVAPLIGALARAQTTVANAYLAPSIEAYLDAVGSALGAGRLRVMTSAGGLQAAAEVRPKDCLLSGPAGGVVGAARAGRVCGIDRLVSFDMGGTSTDVARYDGELDYRFDTELDGIRLLAPALAIETVAAGGGSICGYRAGRLRVGPESAGARPGPACYGAGGPLTLTDVNVLLGRLDPQRFEVPLAREAAERRLGELLELLAADGQPTAAEVALTGLLEIADERMAEAIRRISVRRGYDPADYTLVAFGGAGGQHACSVASLLGMESVLVPPDASLLSAWGLGHARLERIAERQVLEPVEAFEPGAPALLADLAGAARDGLERDGAGAGSVEVRRSILRLRLAGQESTLDVDHDPGGSIADAFRAAYRSRYGYDPPDRGVEVESVRVVVSTRPEALPAESEAPPGEAAPLGRQGCYLGGAWREVPVYERERQVGGARFSGPALVLERFGALVVAEGWRGRVGPAGSLLLERRSAERGEDG
jgi:5-oxoprolinase (ATP-hydrolysing)